MASHGRGVAGPAHGALSLAGGIVRAAAVAAWAIGEAAAATPSLAERWQRFVDHSAFATVTASYDVLAELDGADRERCAQASDRLAAAIAVHPFSPVLAQRALDCAADEKARKRAAAQVAALRDFLLRDGAGEDPQRPLLLVTEADALALVAQQGGQALYARYQVQAPGGEVRLLVAWFDPATRRERRLHADIVLLWHLLKTPPDEDRYPFLLHGLTRRYLEEAVQAGNPVAELAALTLALARREIDLADAIARIEALALAGEAAAAFELLPLCLGSGDARCAAQAVELVRAHAERGLVEGMLAMALAARMRVPGAGGARAERRWIDGAGARMGQAQAHVEYAQWLLAIVPEAAFDRRLARLLRADARAGHVPAMLLLADALQRESLRALRGESAMRWWTRAADAGSAAARRRLGVAALRAHDDARGWRLLDAAAGGGDRAAMALLAAGLERGDGGLPADPMRALPLYRRAAELGNATAMRRMGRAWLGAEFGLQRRPERAEAWYLSALLYGHRAAALELADLYLAAAPGLEGQPADGIALLEELAAEGFGGARVRLATAMLLGQGMPADGRAAIAQLRALEDEGLSAAGFRLGQAFEFGQGGVAVDLAQARAHYLRAAEMGHLDAIDFYARALYAGRGGKRDRVAALRWWQRAVDQRHRPSTANLAWVRCVGAETALRDPQAGARLVSLELQRRSSANLSDTLAACLAAAGRFEEAVATQQRTLELAALEQTADPDYAVRLALYRKRQAWVDRD